MHLNDTHPASTPQEPSKNPFNLLQANTHSRKGRQKDQSTDVYRFLPAPKSFVSTEKFQATGIWFGFFAWIKT
jgi:hypothetical protein